MISFSQFPDLLWSPLRTIILRIPPSRLLLIPSLGGSVWFVTLAGLLLTWIARGMPQYPGQRSPDVASVTLILFHPLLHYSRTS